MLPKSAKIQEFTPKIAFGPLSYPTLTRSFVGGTPKLKTKSEKLKIKEFHSFYPPEVRRI
jgi:hypothetical protein